jgi:hypothetical protein
MREAGDGSLRISCVGLAEVIVHVAFDAFIVGILVGLLLARTTGRPLLRLPLRCWFFGHSPRWMPRHHLDVHHWRQCTRPACQLLVDTRWQQTFWMT